MASGSPLAPSRNPRIMYRTGARIRSATPSVGLGAVAFGLPLFGSSPVELLFGMMFWMIEDFVRSSLWTIVILRRGARLSKTKKHWPLPNTQGFLLVRLLGGHCDHVILLK